MMNLSRVLLFTIFFASLMAQSNFPCTVPGFAKIGATTTSMPPFLLTNFSTSGISFVARMVCQATGYGDPDVNLTAFTSREITPYGPPTIFGGIIYYNYTNIITVTSDPAETALRVTRIKPAPYIYTLVLVDVSGSQIAALGNVTSWLRNNLTSILSTFNYSRIATATFDGRPGMQLVSDFTAGNDSIYALANRLNGYQPTDNSTNLIGGLLNGYDFLNQKMNSDSITNGVHGKGIIIVVTNGEETAYRYPLPTVTQLRPEFDPVTTLFVYQGPNKTETPVPFTGQLYSNLNITIYTSVNFTDPARDQFITQQFVDISSNSTTDTFFSFKYCSQARGPTAVPRTLTVTYGADSISVPFDATAFSAGCQIPNYNSVTNIIPSTLLILAMVFALVFKSMNEAI